MGKLSGKTAIITGAGRGLGKQIAIRFAEEGANIAVCARSLERLQETERLCREAGADVLCFACDVTNCRKIWRHRHFIQQCHVHCMRA